MPRISVLPPEVVNRIAAGEVVERPASLVKELVENSIDAHATEIDIDLEEGGLKRVTIRDNGVGMDAEDLELAFQSHATSKLRAEDCVGGLFGIATLGFRGEALPSIAAVSEVEVVTRAVSSDHALRFRPTRGSVEPAAGNEGTVIEVANLFYNVPARRKFLRKPPTELSQILQQVTRLALGFPGVRFRVTQKNKTHLDLAAADSLRERVVQIVGEDKSPMLLDVQETSAEAGGGPSLVGLVGTPDFRRNDSRGQHFYVNGRWVKDRTLTHALRSAFQGFLIPGWHPVAYLFLDFPPDAVDVNVHPMKAEVRFRDAGTIYPLVFHAVRKALDQQKDISPPATTEPSGAAAVSDSELQRRRVEQATRDFFESPAKERSYQFRGSSDSRPDFSAAAPSEHPTSIPLADRSFGEQDAAGGDSGVVGTDASGHRVRAFQVLNSYLVLEQGGDLTFIDQHALHEKILYEEILRQLNVGQIIRQKLIVPDVVELAPELMPFVDRAKALLDLCGYNVDRFGERDVAIHAVPRLLDRIKATSDHVSFVEEVFRWLEKEGGDEPAPSDAQSLLEGPYHKLAAMMACKRAVKAGRVLGREEIESLLEKADLADDPRHCPHGRPTSVMLSGRELEMKFDRK